MRQINFRFKRLFLVFVLSVIVVISGSSQTLLDLYKLGDSLLDLKKYEQAKAIFDQIIAKDAHAAKAHNGRGICLEQCDLVEKAAAEYQKAIDLDSNYAAPYANLGNYYVSKQDFFTSKVLFKKYMKLKPKDADGFLRVGNVFSNMELNDSAAYYFDLAIVVDSTSSMAYLYRALLYYKQFDIEKAEAILDRAIKFHHSNETIFLMRGSIYKEKGDYQQANQYFSKALANKPNYVMALLNRAEIHLLLGNYTDALVDTKRAMAIDSTNIFVINTHGWANYYNQNYPHALKMVEKGIKKQPENVKILQLKALVMTKLKNYSEAILAINKAISLSTETTELMTNRIEINLIMNTLPEVFNPDSSDFFRDIKSDNIADLILQTKRKSNKYFYNNLFKKFTFDYKSLGLDEYFMLYLGFMHQKNYKPYQITSLFNASKVEETLHAGNFEVCINNCNKLLKKNPYILRTYLIQALAYKKLGNTKKFEEAYYKHYAFLRAIIATGDGKTCKTAYIITSTIDEYNLITFFGFTAKGQHLENTKNISYDVLECVSGDKTINVYFNTDIPFKSLK